MGCNGPGRKRRTIARSVFEDTIGLHSYCPHCFLSEKERWRKYAPNKGSGILGAFDWEGDYPSVLFARNCRHASANICLPRESRDMTVPIGMAVIAAIS